MRIAFLHQTMGLVNRGSEISTALIASELAKKHDVLVIQAGPKKSDKYKTKIISPLSHAPAPAPTNIFQKILFRLHLDSRARSIQKFTSEAIKPLKKFQPDLIIATNGAVQIKLLHQSMPESKIVVFGRAGVGHDDLSNLQACPDLFIALTHPAQEWAEANKGIATRVVYIPNPISPNKTKKIGLSLPSPVVLTVGALSAYKNHDLVIRAVSTLQASLVLIGDGEESEKISKLLSSYPGDFRWLKEVAPNEIGSYYVSSDIFCFVPDSQESFGRVYLEAMAAGLPIVASDDLIRRSIIGQQGIYVDPHSVESIARGIATAYSIKGKVDYSSQLKPYLTKNVIKEIEKVFYDLVK